MPCGAMKSFRPFLAPCRVSYSGLPDDRGALQDVLAAGQEALVAVGGAQRGEVVGEAADGRGVASARCR